MKIEKIIVSDENGDQVEFNIKDGVGIFITDDDQRLILPTVSEELNMLVLRSVVSKWQ